MDTTSYKTLIALTISTGLAFYSGAAVANKWIAPVAEYAMYQKSVPDTPKLGSLPVIDTDGSFDVAWTTPEQVNNSDTGNHYIVEITQPLAQAKQSKFSLTLARSSSSANDQQNWSLLYDGKSQQTSVYKLPESQYQIRVKACSNNGCSNFDYSDSVNVEHQITANNDSYGQLQNASSKLFVVSNDFEPTGAKLLVNDIVSQPQFGEARITEEGDRIEYSNTSGFCFGKNYFEDSLAYRAKNLAGEISNSASVTIKVVCAGEAPIQEDVHSAFPVGTDLSKFRFYEKNGELFLRSLPSQFASIGHLILPIVKDQGITRFYRQNDAWVSVVISTEMFENINPNLLPSSQVTANDSDGNGFVEFSVATPDGPLYPFAMNDSQVYSLGETTTINVLENDSVSSPGKLTISSITYPPKFGTVTILGDQILYQNNEACGQDYFEYKVRNSSGRESSAATVVLDCGDLVSVETSDVTVGQTFSITLRVPASQYCLIGHDPQKHKGLHYYEQKFYQVGENLLDWQCFDDLNVATSNGTFKINVLRLPPPENMHVKEGETENMELNQ